MVIRTLTPTRWSRRCPTAPTCWWRAAHAGRRIPAGRRDRRILGYVAPILLGGPITAVDDVGMLSIYARARRWRFDGIEPIGPDLLLSLVPG